MLLEDMIPQIISVLLMILTIFIKFKEKKRRDQKNLHAFVCARSSIFYERSGIS